MKLRPLGTKIVVEASAEEEKTAGGIVLPDAAKKKPQEGKVLAIGNGTTLDDGKVVPLSVKVGDTIVFSKYGSTEVTIAGKEYLIMDIDQVYGTKE